MLQIFSVSICCQKKTSIRSTEGMRGACKGYKKVVGRGLPGKVSCQPASRGSSPAVFILHVFSSANEQAAKETMPQERRAKQQRLGHCRNQLLLPSVPKCTTSQFHYLNTFGNTRPKKIPSIAALLPYPAIGWASYRHTLSPKK